MRVGNTDVKNPLELIQIIMAFDSRDWFADKRDRMLYAIVFGISDESVAEYERVGYDQDMIDEYRLMHDRYMTLMSSESEGE